MSTSYEGGGGGACARLRRALVALGRPRACAALCRPRPLTCPAALRPQMLASVKGLPGAALAEASRALSSTLRSPGHTPKPRASVCHLSASVLKAKERGWRPDYTPMFPPQM